MLMINNVSKGYGDLEVLKDINIEFTNGVYGLLAPNGAGKTTLIKILTTLLFPDKGEILWDGIEISSMGEEYRDILGYLPQEFGYYKDYSPRKFLSYLSALKGLDKKNSSIKINELLKLVGLEKVADKKMKKFSGGMIQSVGIAQAMLNNPKILILDEPTAGLDPKERVRFRNLLAELSRNKIVILSTHIVSDIESIANEVIMIKDKTILYKDSVSTICEILEGIIYEIKISFDKVPDFRNQYFSLSEKKEDNKMKIRFVSEKQLDDSWISVKPSIEDVFLYVYKDEVVEEY